MKFSAFYTLYFHPEEREELEQIFKYHPKWLTRLEGTQGFLTADEQAKVNYGYPNQGISADSSVYTNQDDSVYGNHGIWRQVSITERNKYPDRTYYYPDGSPIPRTGEGWTNYPNWTITGEPIRTDVLGRQFQLIHNPNGPSGIQYLNHDNS